MRKMTSVVSLLKNTESRSTARLKIDENLLWDLAKFKFPLKDRDE